MKKFLKEFKTFALKGNVMDLAIGVIIGAAFGKIVSSLVNDIATPFLGMFLGGVSIKEWVIKLPKLFNDTDNFLNVGIFINTVIEFFVLAFVVFVFIKAVNRLKKKEEETPAAPPAPTGEELLLAEIRDLLKAQNDKKDK